MSHPVRGPAIPVEQTERVNELKAYLRLTLWPYLLGMSLIFGLLFWTGNTFFAFWAVALLLNGALFYLAYRQSEQGRLRNAIYLYVCSLVVVSCTVFLFGTTLYPLATTLVYLPTMMAIPYVSERGVLVIAVGMTAVAIAGMFWTWVVEPLPIDVSPGVMAWSLAGMVILIACVSALTLWYNAKNLQENADRLYGLNLQLRQSEKELEKQVAERMAELERTIVALESARDQAEKADAQKTGFLADMSHELRTPLNAVIGFSELLEQQYIGDLNDKQLEYINDILSSAKHLLLLINDILDLSKISSGADELDLSEFSFEDMAVAASALISHRVMIKRLTLSMDGIEGIGQVHADERKLKQVLINLLGNAVKFTPAGGQIKLGARRQQNRLVVWVQDTGIGIAVEEQAKIFENFEQAVDSAARTGEGTGLGLAVSRRLIDAHGGSIRVDSTPGAGSRFEFEVPLANVEALIS